MRRAVLALALAVLLADTAAAAQPAATVRRDAQGTPHVLAKDWEGLGYGYARAITEDAFCLLADVYLTVDGERSRFLGPDGTYAIRNTGTTPNNLNSDAFWQKVKADRRVEKLVALRPPLGPKPEIARVVQGFVQGYNDHLAAIGGPAGVEDPACKGQPWVRPIDEMDVYRRFFQLSGLASAMAALDGLGGAQPPTPPVTSGADAREAAAAVAPGEVDRRLHERGVGSNAVAIGKDLSANGKGLLLGNPHQPWLGAERFYQAHLTIPGKIDVSGGSLFGSPAINIGFNGDLAWSHTVSTARRFAIYEVQLVPGSPTTYLRDGRPTEMQRTTVTIPVKRADGSVGEVRRTLYETDKGPITTSLVGLPLFPWTPQSAFALYDANRENFGRLLNHFFDTNRAGSVAELKTILKTYLGIPWVNTIAADREGSALYADVSSVPGVTNELLAACSTGVGRALDAAQRVQVLDGSRAACDPVKAPDAPAPGILGASRLPMLERRDYVTNSNDSHWLSNPRQPLEGFDRIIGDERTVRSLRTRLGLKMVEERLRAGTKFDAAATRDLLTNNRQHAWELWRDELLATCPQVVPQQACDALRRFPGRDDVDAPGAMLFRRFAHHALAVTPSPYRVPFDPADPVGTPRGLNTDNPQVRDALRQAVADLQGTGIPFDAKLGEHQVDLQHGKRIPIGGGPQNLGLFNHLGTSWDPRLPGYANVREGATYVQTVGFDDAGCGVDAQTFLGHGLATDPTSPWFANGTELLAKEQWTPQPFCQSDVRRLTRVTARFGGGAERVGLLSRTSARRVRGGRVRVAFSLARPARVVLRARGARRAVRRPAGRHVVVLRAPGAREVRVTAGKLKPRRVRVR
jgi:acyl-homoserine-lactone acylase